MPNSYIRTKFRQKHKVADFGLTFIGLKSLFCLHLPVNPILRTKSEGNFAGVNGFGLCVFVGTNRSTKPKSGRKDTEVYGDVECVRTAQCLAARIGPIEGVGSATTPLPRGDRGITGSYRTRSSKDNHCDRSPVHGGSAPETTEGSNYSLDIIGIENNISAYRANYVWNIPGRFTMQ
jgi:hypothetical protein